MGMEVTDPLATMVFTPGRELIRREILERLVAIAREHAVPADDPELLDIRRAVVVQTSRHPNANTSEARRVVDAYEMQLRRRRTVRVRAIPPLGEVLEVAVVDDVVRTACERGHTIELRIELHGEDGEARCPVCAAGALRRGRAATVLGAEALAELAEGSPVVKDLLEASIAARQRERRRFAAAIADPQTAAAFREALRA